MVTVRKPSIQRFLKNMPLAKKLLLAFLVVGGDSLRDRQPYLTFQAHLSALLGHLQPAYHGTEDQVRTPEYNRLAGEYDPRMKSIMKE